MPCKCAELVLVLNCYFLRGKNWCWYLIAIFFLLELALEFYWCTKVYNKRVGLHEGLRLQALKSFITIWSIHQHSSMHLNIAPLIICHSVRIIFYISFFMVNSIHSMHFVLFCTFYLLSILVAHQRRDLSISKPRIFRRSSFQSFETVNAYLP